MGQPGEEVRVRARRSIAKRERLLIVLMCSPQLEHICFSLLCISRAVLEKANAEMDPATTPAVVANTVRALPTKWPPKGRLIVQVNADQENPDSSLALLPNQLVRSFAVVFHQYYC